MTTSALCHVDELPPGGLMAVSTSDGTQLVLCNVDGEIFALEDLCSHGASLLSEGQLIGCEVECVLHKGRFNVKTGQATRRPAKKPVRTYPCTVLDDHIYLEHQAA